jgi:hypothetical protein
LPACPQIAIELDDPTPHSFKGTLFEFIKAQHQKTFIFKKTIHGAHEAFEVVLMRLLP